MTFEEKTIFDKAIEDSTLKVIEIAATANKNLSLGYPINQNFASLLYECTFLRILCDWDILTPKAQEETKCDYGLFETESEEESLEPSAARFLEIVQTEPEKITEEMQREAFVLLPNAIRTLGVMF